MKKRKHWTNCYVCGGKLFRPIDIEEGKIVKCGLCHDKPVFPKRDQSEFNHKYSEANLEDLK